MLTSDAGRMNGHLLKPAPVQCFNTYCGPVPAQFSCSVSSAVVFAPLLSFHCFSLQKIITNGKKKMPET
jgi:hypothetical protein